MIAKDLTGQAFGRLVALRSDGHIAKELAWACRCMCGRLIRVRAHALLSGNTMSCGCLRLERVTSHHLSTSPEYGIWKAAKNRCHNPKAQGFNRYGHRGIQMCDSWRESFEAFYRDMGPRPSRTHSIERIDNDGPYGPTNCRWATQREQTRNNRRNRKLMLNGVTQVITDWATTFGISDSCLRYRLEYHTLAEIATMPRNRRFKHSATPPAD